jgi:hypothetical protein
MGQLVHAEHVEVHRAEAGHDVERKAPTRDVVDRAGRLRREDGWTSGTCTVANTWMRCVAAATAAAQVSVSNMRWHSTSVPLA